MGDEEEEASLGAVRYPVMPSLVALQQMRNRLHLAQLGKKLMKWTALATGKELRRLSIEISALMVGYKEKWSNAFMLLARARYFFPTINTTVLEGISKQACVTALSSPRSVSGVKVKNIDLLEKGCDNYQFLGMSKGGAVIKEAKEAWLELLRMMVLLCQYRYTFALLDLANKNATKHQNVISRFVIPRIITTLRYIKSELDEQEREELFRLKRFKQLKYKKAFPDKRKKDQDEGDNEPEEPEPKAEPEPEPEPEPAPICVPPITDPLELLMHHINEIVRLTEKLENETIPEKKIGLTICDLERLKAQLKELTELVEVSKGPIKDSEPTLGSLSEITEGTDSPCPCETKLEAPISAQIVTAMIMSKSEVKTTISEAILNPRPIPTVASMAASKPLDLEPMFKNRIEELNSHVDQVICMTNRYQCEGLLSKSAEDFLNRFESAKIKIQEFQYQKIVKAKLDRLKDKVTKLEKITTIAQKEDLPAANVRSLMSCCNGFKAKLDRIKSCRGIPFVRSKKLLNKNNKVLSKEAKDKGLVSESGEEFISCDEIKTKIEPHDEPKPQVIDDLLLKLNDVISFLTKYKDGAFISDSIDIKCQTTKAKLDSYKAGPPAGCGKNTCPKTPPPESRGSYIKACSHASSVNSCSAGALVSGQLTITTCGGQSAVIQQSQHSCKSKSTEDSAPPPPPGTEPTCVHKDPSTHSCNSQSYQIARPEKSKFTESGRNLLAVCRSQSSAKVILISKEKKEKTDPKACQKASLTTTVRTYKKFDGSIVEETKTITTERRAYDEQKPQSNTSWWRSYASTGNLQNNDLRKLPSKTRCTRSMTAVATGLSTEK